MKIERASLYGVEIITPDVYKDDRGYFKETLNQHMRFEPKQSNQSVSKKGVIRGLHSQMGAAKLVWVAKGSIYDVAFADGKWVGVELSADNHKQLYIPSHIYHGFQALEDDTVVCYLMSDYYDSHLEHAYNPLSAGIDWPLAEKIISEKDRNAYKFLSK